MRAGLLTLRVRRGAQGGGGGGEPGTFDDPEAEVPGSILITVEPGWFSGQMVEVALPGRLEQRIRALLPEEPLGAAGCSIQLALPDSTTQYRVEVRGHKIQWVPRKKMLTIFRNRKSAAACRDNITDLKSELARLNREVRPNNKHNKHPGGVADSNSTALSHPARLASKDRSLTPPSPGPGGAAQPSAVALSTEAIRLRQVAARDRLTDMLMKPVGPPQGPSRSAAEPAAARKPNPGGVPDCNSTARGPPGSACFY